MSAHYEEIVEGETFRRSPPDQRHELICARLHERFSARVAAFPAAELLALRSIVKLSAGTFLRPDLALVTRANSRLWLAVEVINSRDHRIDTVTKKCFYEEMKVPRLWMVDPRYDNVEIYHGGQYGLTLKHIFAGQEELTEGLLPGLQIKVAELFG